MTLRNKNAVICRAGGTCGGAVVRAFASVDKVAEFAEVEALV